MEIIGTRDAFTVMLQQRGIYKKLGVDRSTVSGWKIYLKEGKSISLDKMEEMLEKSGSVVLQEKVWKIPGDILLYMSREEFAKEAADLFNNSPYNKYKWKIYVAEKGDLDDQINFCWVEDDILLMPFLQTNSPSIVVFKFAIKLETKHVQFSMEYSITHVGTELFFKDIENELLSRGIKL